MRGHSSHLQSPSWGGEETQGGQWNKLHLELDEFSCDLDQLRADYLPALHPPWG